MQPSGHPVCLTPLMVKIFFFFYYLIGISFPVACLLPLTLSLCFLELIINLYSSDTVCHVTFVANTNQLAVYSLYTESEQLIERRLNQCFKLLHYCFL